MTRQELRDYVDEQRTLNNIPYHVYSALIDGIDTLEQEPQTFKWCTGCREYNQEKHCCPRWSKVIRNTVEEMKQEYIEREVLDKIRAEIKSLERFEIREEVTPLVNVDKVLEIIDKAESEYV